MRGASSVTALAAIALAAVSLVLSALSLRPEPARPPAGGAPRAGPATLDVSLIITGVGPPGQSRHHVFEPSMIVARRGDTLRVRVMNQSFAGHRIEFRGYGATTGVLPGGPKGQETITFVADKPGMFQFKCTLPYNPATGDCSPDHDTQIGYLVVLEAPR